MRKVVYSVGVSLDGYIAAQDGSVDWLTRASSKAKGEDFGLTAFFKSIDTVLMGRKTYEKSLELGASKSLYAGMKNYVFSRTLAPGERDGVGFISTDPVLFIEDLKRRPGKNIWLCGGGELARTCIAAKCVDEIVLGIMPVLVGGGIATFPPEFPETVLELVECKQYKAGVIGLTYRVVKSQPPGTTTRTSKKGSGKSR